MTEYRERPICRKWIEDYLSVGLSLNDLLDTKNITLTKGMREQVLKMIKEENNAQ